jgi:hypothetical protein
LFVPTLYSVSIEQQGIQSNRAAEQTVAEQSAGYMTCALLSCDGPCTSAVVCLGVITGAFEEPKYQIEVFTDKARKTIIAVL